MDDSAQNIADAFHLLADCDTRRDQGGKQVYRGQLQPEGPWTAACKVATHAMPKNNNDCYNPFQHDELQREGGRVIYFSGTFVNTFSGNPTQTPYYDYNNLFYRLDVSDPRLKFPDPPPGIHSGDAGSDAVNDTANTTRRIAGAGGIRYSTLLRVLRQSSGYWRSGRCPGQASGLTG